MTHPTREQWLSYLYDETENGDRRALLQHLNQCEECRARCAAWQETRRHLDTWKIQPHRATATVEVAWSRWALAAAAAFMVLAAGFALGRFTGISRADAASLRAEVAALKADLQPNAETAARAEAQRQIQNLAAGFNARFLALQAQHASDYTGLHRELETVAVLTEAGFNQTENRFVQLAGYDGNPRTTESPR